MKTYNAVLIHKDTDLEIYNSNDNLIIINKTDDNMYINIKYDKVDDEYTIHNDETIIITVKSNIILFKLYYDSDRYESDMELTLKLSDYGWSKHQVNVINHSLDES